MKILNEEINFELFEKYNYDIFLDNLIVPMFEDDISIHLIVCKDSKLNNVDNFFNKLIKFKEIDKNLLLFILSSYETKINLFKKATKCIDSSTNDDVILVEFVDELLLFAIINRASDIHIENYKKSILFRFRVDGRLKTFFVFSNALFKIISSFFKLISNLDITQIRLPMDSRFSRTILTKKYDFRLSTMPTLNSESIVLRILDNQTINKKLDSLGLSKDIYIKLKESLILTQGLILIAGPTGSGKTTTMYSILNELKSDEKKIITVEDPIEYKIDSISQIQINNKIGLDFKLVLKNILRQDPDIIFIGEIRDEFSLEIALEASLTGHLVLASIHANNSIETITRLIDLHADPFLISTTLKLVLSQRLVLKYCESCNATGCKKCNYSKYHGRTTISESLKIDDKLSSMIFKKESTTAIKNYLESTSYKTMYDDGKEKVKNNITSISEVFKAISC